MPELILICPKIYEEKICRNKGPTTYPLSQEFAMVVRRFVGCWGCGHSVKESCVEGDEARMERYPSVGTFMGHARLLMIYLGLQSFTTFH